MARLGELWETQWLPEVKQHLAFWESFDLSRATVSQLIVHFDETLARAARVWDIHFQFANPAGLAASLFEELYLDLFEGASSFEAYRLIEGFDNKSLERDRLLWQLSRKALAIPAIQAILANKSADEVIPELENSAGGRVFLAELQTFLNEYGFGGDPAWLDNPTPLIQTLQAYIDQPDRDLAAELAAVAAEREEQIAKARQRLQGYPQPVIAQFEFLLKAAQHAVVLHEDHAYWIDLRSVYRIRQVIREIGRRLADAGVMIHSDDIFFLTVDEVRETAISLPNLRQHTLVRERQAEMAHFANITPPPTLGTLPPGPPPDNPMTRFLGKFFGTPPAPAEHANEIRGHAGSPGKIQGKARVVGSLAEATKLEPGDILVTDSTGPEWTPLFATAAAVVTNTGGILSHCACVAREYRLPAVVGTQVATQVIRDGQHLEVDGDAGVVRLL
jgi:pyruvate,water dikinase